MLMTRITRIVQIREAIELLEKNSSVVEVGKYQWQKIISDCHDPLFEEYSGRPDLYNPRWQVGHRYNSGEFGAIDYSFIGDWTEQCYWFVYDDWYERFKIWALEGQLGDIIDCINELGWVNSTITDKKLQKWIVTIRDTVWYCGKGSSDRAGV